jgi:hypothetical protein
MSVSSETLRSIAAHEQLEIRLGAIAEGSAASGQAAKERL